MDNRRVERRVAPLDAREHEIGVMLWGMEDARARTLERLEGMDAARVDWAAPESGNSVGSVLYHIGAIEADYLYADLMQQEFPPEIVALFPYDVREKNGRLTAVRGFDLSWHLHRLAETRSRLLAYFRAMDAADYRRARATDWADITPQWTLHHLMQHEAEHRGELASLRARAEAQRGG